MIESGSRRLNHISDLKADMRVLKSQVKFLTALVAGFGLPAGWLLIRIALSLQAA